MKTLLASLLLLIALVNPASAKRVALVIGNNAYVNYDEETQLQKAVNDADSVRDTLQSMGFEVTHRANAGLSEFKRAVFEFSGKIEKGDVALFYYAGHGAALKGANYFLPSDLPRPKLSGKPTEQEIDRKTAELAEFSVREAFVLEQISKREPKVSLIVMDACRDNPLRDDLPDSPFRNLKSDKIAFGDNMKTSEQPQTEGMIIIYSASFGQRALDRLSDDEKDPNSPFTRSFLKNLKTPGMGLKQVVAATKEEVFRLARSIDEKQTPAVYDQLFGGDVFLNGGAAPVVQENQTALKRKPNPDVGLSICNRNKAQIRVALGYKDKDSNGDWQSQGWWNVEPGECRKLINAALAARYYYVRAVDFKGGGWWGKHILCGLDTTFKVDGFENCEARGYKRLKFFEIDTSDKSNWSVEIK